MDTGAELRIRPVEDGDRPWMLAFIVERWGSEVVVAHGEAMEPADLPGFVAEREGELAGLVTYRIDERGCEVVTIDATVPHAGVGTALLEALATAAREAGASRLWLVTTNDNLDALRFYQRRGFRLAALRPDRVKDARRHKPEIPDTGAYGIPIRDELELERALDREPGDA